MSSFCSRALSFASLALLFSAANADLIPYIQDEAYDRGEFGSYPLQTYRSSSLNAPRPNILASDRSCDDGSYIFMNPRGHKVPDPNPVILDGAGNLVWTLPGKPYGQTYNFNVQEFDGEQYLTFWGGDDAIGGHGQGSYYMLDKTYTQVREINSAGPIPGDLHEFRFTKNGTALMTVYDITPMDLSPIGGPVEGWVWDGSIQEMDLRTGELIFQWKSTSHYTIDDNYNGYGGGGDSPSSPYDYFHINSIDKDDKGNYLISARYTHSVTYIDGRTGEVLWQLGGKRNNFTDLTAGRATNFAWQHDARWHDNHTTITLFDNQAESGFASSEFSRGLKIAIDTEAMTASLVTEYINPQHILSSSQGSVQVLPNGHVLLGYGYAGAFTEYSANGAVLCDVHFGSANRFESGDVQSYRVLKGTWTGLPNTRPDIKIDGESVFVSWNGATEVHRWVLQDADQPDGYHGAGSSTAHAGNGATNGTLEDEAAAEIAASEAWYSIATVEKAGFETELRFTPDTARRYLRVVALDKQGRILGASQPGSSRFDVINTVLDSPSPSQALPSLPFPNFPNAARPQHSSLASAPTFSAFASLVSSYADKDASSSSTNRLADAKTSSLQTASFLTNSAGAGAGPFAFLLGAAALCSLVVGAVCAAFARAKRREDAAYARLVDEEAKDDVVLGADDDVCVDRRLYDVEDEEAGRGSGFGSRSGGAAGVGRA